MEDNKTKKIKTNIKILEQGIKKMNGEMKLLKVVAKAFSQIKKSR